MEKLRKMLAQYFGGEVFGEQRELILALTDALKQYGGHREECDIMWKGAKHQPQCTCGWDGLRKYL